MLRLSIGDPQADTEAEREAYQEATLTISGLLWCVIEPPRTDSTAKAEALWIDAGRLQDLTDRTNAPAAPDDALAWWIFVQQWNAFIYVAGNTATVAIEARPS